MKKLIYPLLILLLLTSCAVMKNQSTIAGIFYGTTPRMGSFVPPGEMSLSLSSDGTFGLNWLDVDYSGVWELSNKGDVLLKFNRINDPTILLRSGIISDQEKEIKVLNKNKLRFDSWVLKRGK